MLRLLWQELRLRRNAILLWALGLCFFPIVYLGVYPQVAEEMQNLADLAIYQAMGVSLGSLEDWIGSVLILFVPLVLSIYAIVNATGTLAGEEEDGRLEMIVTLPLPRWQIVAAKALALSIATFLILLIVSLVTGGVFMMIEGQVETDLTALDLIRAVIATWPFVFAIGMISLFLAAFTPHRRIASAVGIAILLVSYLGNNLSNTVSSVETVQPLFLFNYLDYTGAAVTDGQPAGGIITLALIGLISFGLAVFFFQKRKLTVSMWPWQRGNVPVS